MRFDWDIVDIVIVSIISFDGAEAMADKSSSGDEIPERDMTYRLICLLIYH